MPGQEVPVGETGFEEGVRVTGPEDHLLAVLDAPSRSRVQARIHDHGALVQQGQAQILMNGVVRDGARLHASLLAVRDLARDLALSPPRVPRALAHNAHSDPEAEVRVRNLEALLTHHPDHPVLANALQGALEDSCPAMRLLGASHPRTSEPVGTGGLGEAVLLELLSHPVIEVQRLAARALGEVGSLEAVVSLQALAQGSRGTEPVRQEALQAIRALQGRLGADRPGALAIQEGSSEEEGALSLSEASSGGAKRPTRPNKT